MIQTNANCRFCGGKGTVLLEIQAELARATCTNCHRASRWITDKDWHGLAFHAGQMRQAEAGTHQGESVPTDLIPIARAAKLVGRHPNTISTRINLGYIKSYPTPGWSRHPKKKQRMVSRAEIERAYGLDKPAQQAPAPAPQAHLEGSGRQMADPIGYLEGQLALMEAPAGPEGQWVPCTCGQALVQVRVGGRLFAAYGPREVERWLEGIGHPLHDILEDTGTALQCIQVAKGLCSPEPATKVVELPGTYQVARGRGKGQR